MKSTPEQLALSDLIFSTWTDWFGQDWPHFRRHLTQVLIDAGADITAPLPPAELRATAGDVWPKPDYPPETFSDLDNGRGASEPDPATPPTTDGAAMREAEDTRLLDTLRDECWDLRSFDVPTGGGDADVAWRVVGHWQAEPHERVIAEAYSDDPRAALRAALAPSNPEVSDDK